MQKGLVGKNSWAEAIAKYDAERANKFTKLVKEVTIPNINRLTQFFRERDMPIIFLTLGHNAEIMPEIKTQFGPREFLVTKFSAGPFATSALDNVLRELGISTLFIVGSDIPACVNATFWGAYDRSYQTIMITDACCSAEPQLAEAAIKIWTYMGFVRSVDQVISDYPWQHWVDPSVRPAVSETL